MDESSNSPDVESSPVDGWDEIGELLTGFGPEQVGSLIAARELEPIYPLLHSLTRGSLRDFIVRVATLEALVADGRSPLTHVDVASTLYWLNEPAVDSVLRIFRESGWISYDPRAGYRITESGYFVSTVLSFLRGRVSQENLLPTVEGIDYMLRLGVDPVHQVLLLRVQLENLRRDMENARDSHSEVILSGASARLQDTLNMSQRMRAVLRAVPLEMTQARRTAQDIHDLLSRLYGVAGELHAAITQVGRQYLHLVAGLTTTNIVETLMQLPVDELAEAGQAAAYPVIAAPPFVVPELVATEAEAYLSLQREPVRDVDWNEPPEPDSADVETALPDEIHRLLDHLDRLAEAKQSQPFAAFVPKRNAAESFLRASLLPLVGERVSGQGVAGRLGALPLVMDVEGDGLPQPAAPPLSELSRGSVHYTKEPSDG